MVGSGSLSSGANVASYVEDNFTTTTVGLSGVPTLVRQVYHVRDEDNATRKATTFVRFNVNPVAALVTPTIVHVASNAAPSSVVLFADATGSVDVENAAMTYSWTATLTSAHAAASQAKTSLAPTVVDSSGSGPLGDTVFISNLAPAGTYDIRVRADDGEGGYHSTTNSVTINMVADITATFAPVSVQAGSAACVRVTLKDRDGSSGTETVRQRWTLYGVDFAGVVQSTTAWNSTAPTAAAACLNFTDPTQLGALHFQLEVQDQAGGISSWTHKMLIDRPPIAVITAQRCYSDTSAPDGPCKGRSSTPMQGMWLGLQPSNDTRLLASAPHLMCGANTTECRTKFIEVALGGDTPVPVMLDARRTLFSTVNPAALEPAYTWTIVDAQPVADSMPPMIINASTNATLPPAAIINSTSVVAALTARLAGMYTVRLTVADGSALVDTVDVVVSVVMVLRVEDAVPVHPTRGVVLSANATSLAGAVAPADVELAWSVVARPQCPTCAMPAVACPMLQVEPLHAGAGDSTAAPWVVRGLCRPGDIRLQIASTVASPTRPAGPSVTTTTVATIALPPQCVDSSASLVRQLDAGQCGCGDFDHEDVDGDGFANCIDGCPGDPLRVLPGDCHGVGIDDDMCARDVNPQLVTEGDDELVGTLVTLAVSRALPEADAALSWAALAPSEGVTCGDRATLQGVARATHGAVLDHMRSLYGPTVDVALGCLSQDMTTHEVVFEVRRSAVVHVLCV